VVQLLDVSHSQLWKSIDVSKDVSFSTQKVLPVMCNKAIFYLVLTKKEEFIVDLKISSSLRYSSCSVFILILWKANKKLHIYIYIWNFREAAFLEFKAAVRSTDWEHKCKGGNANDTLVADPQPPPLSLPPCHEKIVQGKKLP